MLIIIITIARVLWGCCHLDAWPGGVHGAELSVTAHMGRQAGLVESRIALIARRQKQPNSANREALYKIAKSRDAV